MGPAAVLCQRGQSVWVHTNGDIRKVAACKEKIENLKSIRSKLNVRKKEVRRILRE